MKLFAAFVILLLFSFGVLSAESGEIANESDSQLAQDLGISEKTAEYSSSEESPDTAALRDSLFERLRIQEAHYSEFFFDNAVLFSPNRALRQHFIGNDLFNWADALRANPNFVSVYYSPDFPMNRALFRTYTLPLEHGLLSRLYSPALPWENIDLLEIRYFSIRPTGGIAPAFLDGRTVTPDVFFAWQGGLLDGNTVNFRMMRNLSENLSLSAFIAYSDLKRKNFYRGGGVASMYRTYHSDTTRIVIRGYNPLSLVSRGGFTLDYRNDIRANIRYSYSDIRQDFAFATDSALSIDIALLNIAWSESRNFLHQIDGMLEIPIGERFLLRNLGRVESVEQSESPLSRTDRGNFATQHKRQTHTLQSAGSKLFFAPVDFDTLSVSFSVNRHIAQNRDYTHTVVHHSKFIAENKLTPPNSDNLSLTTSGGVQLLRANAGEIQSHPLGLAEIDWNLGNLNALLWGRIGIAPLIFLTPLQENEAIADNLSGFGVNLRYQFAAASVHGGFSALNASREQIFWHEETMPFRNPGNVFSLGANLGEIGKVSMFSDWFFRDRLPHLISYSGFRFRFSRPEQIRQFYAEFFYNYWSRRSQTLGGRQENTDGYNPETGEFRFIGDFRSWNRSIHDISLKFSAQMHTFRMFWKIDNILNRANAYVPGYIMPGIIFRWGFSWNILG